MGKIQIFFLTIGAVLLGLLGLFTYAKRVGAQAEQASQNKRTLKVIRDAQEARNTVSAQPDSDVADSLRNKWSRD